MHAIETRARAQGSPQTHATPGTHAVWGGLASDHEVVVQLSRSSDATCSIMQECTADVSVSGLPPWPGGANTATLPCGHVFHPCALAMHFALRNMLCPICRQGAQCRLDVSGLPSEISGPLSNRMEVESSDDDSEISDEIEVDENAMLQPLQLVFNTHHGATQHAAERVCVVSTRVIVPPEDTSAPDAMVVCETHRSFRRRLCTVMSRQDFQRFTVDLVHPLIGYPFSAQCSQSPVNNSQTLAITCPQAFGDTVLARVVVTHQPFSFDVTVVIDRDKINELCANFLVSVLSNQILRVENSDDVQTS